MEAHHFSIHGVAAVRLMNGLIQFLSKYWIVTVNKIFKIIWVLFKKINKKRQGIKTLGSLRSHFQLHFQSVAWHSGMWGPVMSGAFWKWHPGRRVRSCSLLPGFKAQAQPLVAAGWVISSWAGTGCIGRAPSPWAKQLHPCCPPVLAFSSTSWVIEYPGLSALRLRGALYSLWEDKGQPAGWKLAVGGRKGFKKPLGDRCGCGGTSLVLHHHSSPHHHSFPLPCPQDADWRITEIGLWSPGTSLFLPAES